MPEGKGIRKSTSISFEKAARFVAYVSPLLAGTALLKIHIYYSSFGITILDYIELSEALSFIIFDIFRFILLTASILTGMIISIKNEIKNTQKEQTSPNALENNTSATAIKPLSRKTILFLRIIFALFLLYYPVTKIIDYNHSAISLEDATGNIVTVEK